MWWRRLDSAGSGYGPVLDFYEHCNVVWNFVKGGELARFEFLAAVSKKKMAVFWVAAPGGLV
jgi:hypothetical protein